MPSECYNIEQDFGIELNPEQKSAILHTKGPLLILAGAGTGKTRVLTTRLVNIINSKLADPSEILAVTFTNKAANEMKERVERIIGGSVNTLNIGTFHSISAKILRHHAHLLGLSSDFTILPQDEQIKLVKNILKNFNIDEAKYPPKYIAYLINKLKDKAYTPQKVPSSMDTNIGNVTLISKIYAEYQAELQYLNAADFGDLLLHNINLFNNNLDVLSYYQGKFRYILVDEYQDTNVAQYMWLRILAQKHNNICCVGDDDQSIYGWRGAEIANILQFDKDFVDATVIRLVRNYRSTRMIIKGASGIISFNSLRHPKEIFSEAEQGDPIKLLPSYDDREEGRKIVEEINLISSRLGIPLNEIAILIRAGYQTRVFEENLNFLHIPYIVVGGIKFYERAEIKDVLAYIRFLVNPGDALAFERLIAVPRRGIGPTTIQSIFATARENHLTITEAINILLEQNLLKGKSAESLQNVIDIFNQHRLMLDAKPHSTVVENMLIESGYIDMHKFDNDESAKDRLDNIKELLRNLQEYQSLKEYLEHISLVMDADTISSEQKVKVMTMHSAKGLEFDTVFLPGWEEGVFPSQKSIDEGTIEAIEEERRLAYVAITRAKKRLYISYAASRRIFNHYQHSSPSRFIEELPKDTYEVVNKRYYFKSADEYY